jgi:hypothetical protein
LNTELITASKEGERSYHFHVPKRTEALAFFNQALISNVPLVVRLEAEKPRAIDWNAQLNQSGPAKGPNVGTQPGADSGLEQGRGIF